jgi:uncharacterized membrane protein (UPF0127 family)
VHGLELLAVPTAAAARSFHAAGRYRAAVRRLVVVAVVAALMATACSGDNSPTVAPTTVAVTTAPSSSVAVPKGYDAVVLRVTDATGVTREFCVLVADTEPKRERGLMDVDSLGGYDGMLFRFGSPTNAQFYMFQTRLALSIAFFGGGGTFVSSTDMPPCTASRPGDCPVYDAAGPYVDALEVPMGGLAALGAGAGSRIATGAACSRTG